MSFNLGHIATVGYNVSGVSVCSPQPSLALVRDVSIFIIIFWASLMCPFLFASLFGTPLLLNCFWRVYHFCLESIHISVEFNSAFYIGVVNADLLFCVSFSCSIFLSSPPPPPMYLFVYSCTCVVVVVFGGGFNLFVCCFLLFVSCFVLLE